MKKQLRAKKMATLVLPKMFIFLVFLVPVLLLALPKLPSNGNMTKNIFIAIDDEVNCKRYPTIKVNSKDNVTTDMNSKSSNTSKLIRNVRNDEKIIIDHLDETHLKSIKSISKKSSDNVKSAENQPDIKDIGYAPKIFQKYATSLSTLLRDLKKENDDNVKFEILFENKGKLFQIEGDGETHTIADTATITLNLCRIRQHPEIDFLNGIIFIKCTYTKFPPKYAATKIRARKIEWIYPLLPGINTFQLDKNGVFLFPDFDALAELDKGAFGLILSKDRKHYKERKLGDIRKFFLRLLKIVFEKEITRPFKRQKRQISIENILDPENDLSLLAEEIHNLKNEAAEAAKATEGIEKTKASGDFWEQLCDKAVKILHYVMGIDMTEVKEAVNSTVSLARNLVNNLAVIKQSIDETQSIMKKKMRNIALNVMKNSFGKQNVGLASDFLEMINNLEKTRKNLRGLIN